MLIGYNIDNINDINCIDSINDINIEMRVNDIILIRNIC